MVYVFSQNLFSMSISGLSIQLFGFGEESWIQITL